MVMDKATRSKIAKSLRTAAAKLVAKAPVMPDAPKFHVEFRVGGKHFIDYISDQFRYFKHGDVAERTIIEVGQKQVDAAFKVGFEAGYQQGLEHGAEEEAFRR